MATFSDMADNYRQMIRDLETTRESEALQMTFEALALVKRRVINSGQNADGGDFGGYSKSLIEVYKLAQNDGVTARDTEKLLNKHGYFASYHDLRDVKGYALFKNFSFTNKMWNAIVPTVASRSLNIVSIVFSTPDALGQFKIVANTARDGDFLALAFQERELLKELNNERFQNLLIKNNLA